MELSPDDIVVFEAWGLRLTATLAYTWAVMAVLVGGSWAVTRGLSTGPDLSRWQTLLEGVVSTIRDQIREASRHDPDPYLPFVGTLFLFIAASTLLDAVPGVRAPTASLTTAAALAACVFVAVPVYGVARQGWRAYLRHYVRPTPLMLPFNVIGELSRTVALAVRLFGNAMSGGLVVAILLSLAPLFFPVVMQAFGLLIGLIQAYVFAVLALVYIASGTRAATPAREDEPPRP
jgi:F-type H+-transporting ATPase subunit a